MSETHRCTAARRLSRGARRAQLLVAARDVFAAQGYHAAAMDDIAERAGVSKPVLYQHFPGKLELYRALLTTYADELVERVARRWRPPRTTEERAQAAVAAYFDFVAGEGKAYRLVFESDLRGEPAAAVVEGAMNRCIDTVAAAVTTDAGLDRPRARLLAVGLVGLSQVAAQYWLDSEQTRARDEAVALMSSLAWRGLAGFPLMERPTELRGATACRPAGRARGLARRAAHARAVALHRQHVPGAGEDRELRPRAAPRRSGGHRHRGEPVAGAREHRPSACPRRRRARRRARGPSSVGRKPETVRGRHPATPPP